MRSTLLILLSLTCLTFCAKAQNASSSASQRVVLQLNPIIEFSSALNFGANQQELKVRSNSNFIINAEKATFGKSGYQVISNGSNDVVLNGAGGNDKTFAINNKSQHTKGVTDIVVYTATEP